MKALMAKEALVTFPDFTKEFEIHTDASKLQLGVGDLYDYDDSLMWSGRYHVRHWYEDDDD